MIVIVDGDCGRVVVTQHGFGGDAVIQQGGANLRIANQSRVAEVDVEILILLEDVVVNHSDCDLWEKNSLFRMLIWIVIPKITFKISFFFSKPVEKVA